MSFTDYPNGITSYGIPQIGYPGVFSIPRANGSIRLVGPNEKYTTISAAIADCVDGDTVLLTGNNDYTETTISTPAGVDYVSVIGMGNQPRSTRWKNSNEAAPFITVRGSGWTFRNIYFAGGTSDYCIELLRNATYNASEARILDCVFNGGSGHIEQNGGVANVIIAGNRFIGGRGGTATEPGNIIGTSTAQAVPTNWEIVNNRFYNGISQIACSMSRSLVKDNFFQGVGHDGAATNKVNLNYNSSQGDYNTVVGNYFGVVAADVDTGNGFKDGSNSVWANNFTSDGSTGDTPWYGVPTA